MNNNDQDSPTDNGVDRAPILDFIKELLDAGANVERAHARGAAQPALALLAERRLVGRLHRPDAVPARGAVGRYGDDAAAASKRGADPNLPTLAGTTPLMAAAGVNWVVAQTYTESPQARLDAVKLCLELGADVNATNSMGLTALLGAVEPRLERHHRAARQARRAARHQGQGRADAAALGGRRVPRRGRRRAQAGDDRAARAADR